MKRHELAQLKIGLNFISFYQYIHITTHYTHLIDFELKKVLLPPP